MDLFDVAESLSRSSPRRYARKVGFEYSGRDELNPGPRSIQHCNEEMLECSDYELRLSGFTSRLHHLNE